MATAALEVFSNFVVVGGGIAGVSCAEQLSALNPTSSIILITSSTLVKAVTNFKKVSRTLETFEVDERATSYLTQSCPNVTIVQGLAQSLNTLNKTVSVLSDNHPKTIRYDRLCICTGAVPNVVFKDHPLIIGIRDTESVKDLQDKVKHAKRVIVIGNGGIAIELVYEIKYCQVVWAIKDSFIGNTFFDEGAARFFLPSIDSPRDRRQSSEEHEESKNSDTVFVKTKPLKRMKYMLDPLDGEYETKKYGTESIGSALGPDWCEGLHIKGNKDSNHMVHVEYNCQMECMLTHDEMKSKNLLESYIFDEDSPSTWPVYVKLTNGKVVGCDLIISATGVVPNTQWFCNSPIKLSDSDGGILVDSEMRTNCTGVYAAGDVCSVDWVSNVSHLWFQMRLWSQARQMGSFAAQCMSAHEVGNSLALDFCFEIFAHVTKFFGFKVVLLGLYNCQGLDNYELLLRITEGTEYVKVILQGGRMVGAILIGDTDLEETFENLMLNQMDLSSYKDSLLDPGIDIEDYFD